MAALLSTVALAQGGECLRTAHLFDIHLTPNLNAAFGSMLSFFTLFGGLIIPFNGLALWWKWTFYINPFAFMLEAIVAPQVRRSSATRR